MTVDATGPTPAVDLAPLRDDYLYTAEEASPYVNVSPRFLKRAAGNDQIQHTYVGRFPRWNAQHIRDIVAGRRHVAGHRERQTRKSNAA